MEVVVTLIHGTFAKKAAWTKPNSFLSNSLLNKFSKQIHLQAFQWSGWNSPVSRMNAGKKLKAYLLKTLEQHPNAKHYIIAHSHGGNVALEALRDNNVERKISGVVCLSTPFLHVRSRGMRSLLVWQLGLGMGLIFLLSIWSFLVPLLPLEEFRMAWRDGILAILGVISLPFSIFLAKKWSHTADELIKVMEPANISNKKILLIRSIGDEASLLLASSEFAAFLMSAVMNVVQRLLLKIPKAMKKLNVQTHLFQEKILEKISFGHGRFLMGVANGFPLIWCWILYINSLNPSLELGILPPAEQLSSPHFFLVLSILFSINFYFFIKLDTATWAEIPSRIYGLGLMGILGIPLMALEILVFLISMIPLGPRLAFCHPFVDVAVDNTPVGKWVLHQFSPIQKSTNVALWKIPEISIGEDSYLIHSSAYNDPRVIDLIYTLLDGKELNSEDTANLIEKF